MRKFGSILTGLAGIAFLGTAVLHASGYAWIVEQSSLMTAEAELVVPPLWLMFSANMVILGLILLAVAVRPGRAGPLVVLLAALGPLAAAGLLARGIRLGGPVPVLVSVAGLALVAAAVLAVQVRVTEPGPSYQTDIEGNRE